MSRSYRRTRIFPNAGNGSDKFGKQKASRALRRRVRMGDYDAMPKERGDNRDWSKDGKHYWEHATDKDMRK
jgi:hypothetical protein